MRVVAETGSTNADLLAEAAAGAADGRWLRAERQTGGRGRLGRDWLSPPGNLYASTIVRLTPADPPALGLALVAGIAMHAAASVFAGPAAGRLMLKWPNDLMTDGAKLGGILVERQGDAAIVGFGLNLAHAPDGIGRVCTSLAELVTGSADPFLVTAASAPKESGRAIGTPSLPGMPNWVAEEASPEQQASRLPPPDPGAAADVLAVKFAHALATWRRDGLEVTCRHWLDRAHPLGTPLVVGTPERPIHGRFAGLTTGGALRLEEEGEAIRIVHAGDVGLLP